MLLPGSIFSNMSIDSVLSRFELVLYHAAIGFTMLLLISHVIWMLFGHYDMKKPYYLCAIISWEIIASCLCCDAITGLYYVCVFV